MMRSFFTAFLALKWIEKFFYFMSYSPQNPTLWPGQSLSSPRFSGYTYIHTRFPYGILNKTRFDRFSAVSTNFAILQILRNTGRPPAYNGIETFSIRAKINLFRKSQNRRPQPALRRKLPESQKYPRTPRARARVRNKEYPP